jgi:hypothetical protein
MVNKKKSGIWGNLLRTQSNLHEYPPSENNRLCCIRICIAFDNQLVNLEKFRNFENLERRILWLLSTRKTFSLLSQKEWFVD